MILQAITPKTIPSIKEIDTAPRMRLLTPAINIGLENGLRLLFARTTFHSPSSFLQTTVQFDVYSG